MSLSDLIIDRTLPEVQKDSLRFIFKSDFRTWKMPFTGSLDHKGWRRELDENWGSTVGTVVLWLEAVHIIMWSLKLCLRLGDLDIIFKVLLLDGVQSSSSAPITHGVVTEPVCLSHPSSLLKSFCSLLRKHTSIIRFLFPEGQEEILCGSRRLWMEMLWD